MRKRILIVEDNYVLALVFKKMMQKMNFREIFTARSGEEALEQINFVKPDFILMDIMLTGKLNGMEVSEKVRKRSCVPVLFITGQSGREIFERVKAIGNSSLVIKPVSFQDLEEEIHQLLRTCDAGS